MVNTSINHLPLEWIRVFEAAGRLGSFTKAADEIGLTQAAVSQRIRNLEDRLGAQLFMRQPRGVLLTIEGEAWLPYVSNALQTLGRSTDELFSKPLKKIMISASASMVQLWVIPRLSALEQRENYQVSVSTMSIDPDFAKANAMLEIRYGTGAWPGMICAKLYQEELAPMVTPGLLVGGKDWRDLPKIAISGPRLGWQEWAAQMNETVPSAPTYRFDSFVAGLAAAKAGLGVLLGSVPLCADVLDQKQLCAIEGMGLLQDASYWMAAKEGKVPPKQWAALVAGLSKSAT